MQNLVTRALNMEMKWLLPLLVSLVFVLLLATFCNEGPLSSIRPVNSFFSNQSNADFVEPKEELQPSISSTRSRPDIPRFAYLISGSKGELEKLWRTLYALYHPWNVYIVHLDLESPTEERMGLASRVKNDPLFSKVGNVFVISKANLITYRGPTMVANTLHACAILLKESKDWDWFINLSASDYPLITQDDLLYTFSTLDRNLNFIEHTSNLTWKLEKRAMPVMIDPGLYLSNKSDIYLVAPRRSLPTAFTLFTGSAWMVLSRSFVEYIIWGWDNLPRTLLMYYANFVSSPEGYFQTVVCNVPEFAKTVVNHDLHYIYWGHPPRQHPCFLTLNDTEKMVESGDVFARKFKQDTFVLDIIDRDLLRRKNGSFTPGGWCAGKPKCSKVRANIKLKPGPGAQRISGLVDRIVREAKQGQNQCN